MFFYILIIFNLISSICPYLSFSGAHSDPGDTTFINQWKPKSPDSEMQSTGSLMAGRVVWGLPPAPRRIVSRCADWVTFVLNPIINRA